MIQDIIDDIQRVRIHAIDNKQDGIGGMLENIINKLQRRDMFLLHDWNKGGKPVLCIDFDGVISQYKHGWQGVARLDGELPMEGAFDFIRKAINHFSVLIFSARCNDPQGIGAMCEWMKEHGLEGWIVNQLVFQPGKPSFFVHIDDRSIQFTGDWSKLDPEELLNYKPWYYSLPDYR